MSGERAVGVVPRNRGTIQTLIAALGIEGIRTSMMISGGTSGSVFIEFTRQCLIKVLKPGEIVIMDNLAAHLFKEVTQLIKSVGCKVINLPAYSPDLNPIEPFFGWLKDHLRTLQPRKVEDLVKYVGVLCRKVKKSIVSNWYKNCGYRV